MTLKFPTACPSCEGELHVARLVCGACGTHVQGEFPLPALLRLSRDDLAFVLDFVRASGSLKEVAKQRGQSYPTIRNRLNGIIGQLSEQPDHAEQKRNAILDAIAQGKLGVAEGAKLLKETFK